MKKFHLIPILLAGIFIYLVSWLFRFGFASAAPQDCDPLGWFPEDFGLKDHTVFQYDGYYYIASIYLPQENKFAYARSQDLCHWEDLEPILTERTSGDWDESGIWAPYVIEDKGVFYMYYTGVNHTVAQSIMLATSTNPADPTAWQEEGMIFQPSHPKVIWSSTAWSDCRDPHVIFANGVYYLYYTGLDETGGIIGVASAPTAIGPWTDLGTVITPVPGHIFESPNIFFWQGVYYLIYNETVPGIGVAASSRISTSPTGLWEQADPLSPGWAHEFWLDAEDNWRTSYLTTYDITIAWVNWNPYLNPPRPLIGDAAYYFFLPIAVYEKK